MADCAPEPMKETSFFEIMLNSQYFKELFYMTKRGGGDVDEVNKRIANKEMIEIPRIPFNSIKNEQYHGSYKHFLDLFGILILNGDKKLGVSFSGYQGNPPKLKIKIPLKDDDRESMFIFLDKLIEELEMSTGVDIPEEWRPKIEKDVWYSNYKGCLTIKDGVFKGHEYSYCGYQIDPNYLYPLKLLGKMATIFKKLCVKLDEEFPELDESPFLSGKIVISGFECGDYKYGNGFINKYLDILVKLTPILVNYKPGTNLDPLKIVLKDIVEFNNNGFD